MLPRQSGARWFTANKGGFITYGGDYPGTRYDYRQASQFAVDRSGEHDVLRHGPPAQPLRRD